MATLGSILSTFDMPLIAQTVSLTNQSADIGSTNFTFNTPGLFRLTYYLEDTTADLTAGAVTATFAWTDSGAARTTNSAAVPMTAVSSTQASGSIIIELASGSIAYSTTHTGIFGSAKYALFLTLERLK